MTKPENYVDIGVLAARLEAFSAARDWEQFHSPKNLVMALTAEVGELNEVFQWLNEEASKKLDSDPVALKQAEEEISDVLMYLVRLIDVLGIDINQAIQRKLAINEERYPADQVRGSSAKYKP